jgi:TRAP-type C4-dicarboxylate transport system permease small subunit
MLARLERLTKAAAQTLAAIGLSGLMLYALSTLADGTLRSLANHPLEWVRDLGGLVCAVAVACCFPLAFLERANITIRFAAILLGRRASRVLDALASVAVETAVVLIAWRLFQYALQVRAAHDVTFMLAVRIGPFWIAAAALMGVTALVQAVVVALEVARCFGPAERA